MIRKASIALLALLAACTQTLAETNGSAPAPPQQEQTENACGAERYQSLVGQPRASIDEGALPDPHRIVCHGCAMTMDYRPDRLTIQLGPNEIVESVRCV
ncbi:MAG: I78 family peptidase inhibitor [Hyphomonadaceae bacterium]